MCWLCRSIRQHSTKQNSIRPTAHSKSQFYSNQQASINNNVRQHNNSKIPILHEQRPGWFDRTIDSNPTSSFPHDRIHAADDRPRRSVCSENVSARCDASTFAAKEHDGVHSTGQKCLALLHINFKYHSRRSWSYPSS